MIFNIILSAILLAVVIAILYGKYGSGKTVGLNAEDNQIIGCGRNIVATTTNLGKREKGIVLSTHDNAAHGFLLRTRNTLTGAESDYRCNAVVLTEQVSNGNVSVTLQVNNLYISDDEIAFIPRNMHIADLLLQ